MDKKKIKALIIEDSEDDMKLMLRELKKSSYEIEHSLVEDANGLENALKEEWDVIISDYAMPGFTGNDALKIINEKGIDVPFIIVSGTVGEDIAVEMMKSGAKDYIMKNKMARLLPAIEREIKDAKIRIEKQKSEKKLRESERTLSSLVKNLPGMVYQCKNDKDWTMIFISDGCYNITGYKPDDLINNKTISFNELILPQYVEPLWNKWQELLKNKEPFFDEYEIKTASGEIKWLWERGSGVFNNKGELLFLEGYIEDITERKNAEINLRSSQQLIEGIINSIPVRVFWKDKNLNYLGCNDAFVKDSGYTELRDIIGKDDFQMGWREQAELYRKDDREVIEKGIPKLHIEEQQTTPDGKTITLLTSKIPLRNFKGEINGVLGIYLDITERKHAEEEIIKSNIYLSTLIEYAPVAIAVLDEKSNVQKINKRFTNYFGYTSEESLGKWLNELIVPKEYYDEANKLCEENELDNFGMEPIDTIRMDKFGNLKDVSIIGSPIKVNNKFIGIYAIYQDITERKRAEEILQEKESSLRYAQEIAKMGSWEWDIEKHITKYSENYYAIFGFNPSEVEPGFELFKSRVHPDDIQILDESYLTIMRDKIPYSIELRILDTDGTYKWTQNSIVPVIENDKLVKLKGVIIDITERKQIEEEIRKSEEKYRSLIENMGEGIGVTDDEEKFIFVNPAAEKIFGVKQGELIGDNLKTFHSSEIFNEVINRTKERRHGKSDVYEDEIILKDGSKKVLFVHATPWFENNIFKGTFAIFSDITEQKKMVNELIEAKEKAEEMNRLKSSFLANMSHELRTPLNGILGFSEIIQETNDFEKVKKMSEIINKNGNRLLNTLNQILNLSLLEANTKKVEYRYIDIVSLVNETTELYRIEAAKKNLKLHFESEISKLQVAIDPTLVTNILNNLVNNAIVYSEKGGIIVKLGEEIINGVESIVIDVIDTGIGIEKKNLEIIFDEFRQASEGWGRSFEGTGLGLSLCKKYAKLLGGSINVTSEIGVGSDFKVILPKISTKTKENEKEVNKFTKNPLPDLKQNEKSKKPEILYVEDEFDSIEIVKLILSSKYKIDISRNGEDAIEMAKSKKYDLILLDINLRKGMSGLDALAEIKKSSYYNTIPVIALTAFAMKGDREEFLSKGCTDYISKPFSRDILLQKVSYNLSLHR